MSLWYEITDKDDVDYDAAFNSIDVSLDNDDFGCRYVTIPVEYIIEVLTKNGLINAKI